MPPVRRCLDCLLLFDSPGDLCRDCASLQLEPQPLPTVSNAALKQRCLNCRANHALSEYSPGHSWCKTCESFRAAKERSPDFNRWKARRIAAGTWTDKH